MQADGWTVAKEREWHPRLSALRSVLLKLLLAGLHGLFGWLLQLLGCAVRSVLLGPAFGAR